MAPRPTADPSAAETLGPIPEDNRPGHHPPVEQDKPTGPPPRPAGSIPRTERFAFRVDRSMALPALLLGITPGTTEVVVGPEDLSIRFGRWSLRTPLTNVDDVTVTGPYRWPKVAGPPHLSLADGGITFATSTKAGAWISFHRRVPAVLPVGLIRHPSATVTVEDPKAFAEAVRAAVRRVRPGSAAR